MPNKKKPAKKKTPAPRRVRNVRLYRGSRGSDDVVVAEVTIGGRVTGSRTISGPMGEYLLLLMNYADEGVLTFCDTPPRRDPYQTLLAIGAGESVTLMRLYAHGGDARIVTVHACRTFRRALGLPPGATRYATVRAV
jgi:hypothetical protein